jgi:hypothetical protein
VGTLTHVKLLEFSVEDIITVVYKKFVISIRLQILSCMLSIQYPTLLESVVLVTGKRRRCRVLWALLDDRSGGGENDE